MHHAGTIEDTLRRSHYLLDELILSGNYAIDDAGTMWVDLR